MLQNLSANENAARAKKKTIRPEDVIEAAKELEFDAFVPQLQSALQSECPFHFRIRVRRLCKRVSGYSYVDKT